MRILPILFNTEMVRAILDGRKIVTRRIIKLNQGFSGHVVGEIRNENNPLGLMYPGGIKRPPYLLGDILYVRETWYKDKYRYMYSANYANDEKFYRGGVEEKVKWHPSIHMPKDAARIFLKVKDVRVERLQDMPHDGALKEGIHFCKCPDGYTWKTETDMHNCYTTPMGAMQALWNSTIKKTDLDRYGWDANPWVWVIEFERCDRPEERCCSK